MARAIRRRPCPAAEFLEIYRPGPSAKPDAVGPGPGLPEIHLPGPGLSTYAPPLAPPGLLLPWLGLGLGFASLLLWELWIRFP